MLDVGLGNFILHSETAAPEGELPVGFGRYGTHSTWTGAFAETGIPGLHALLGLVAGLLYYRPETWTVPAILLVVFLVASVLWT